VLKKTITYTDYNGDEVTEEFIFNFSPAEAIALELSHKGGLGESLKRIVAANDGEALVKEFTDLIGKAYGIRSPDGKRITKNAQIREEFESSAAYSVLFMELATDADKLAAFVNGAIPGDALEKFAKEQEAKGMATDPNVQGKPKAKAKAKPKPVRELTRRDVEKLPMEEFAQLGAKIASGEWKLAEE
jgi:hypothetical protein